MSLLNFRAESDPSFNYISKFIVLPRRAQDFNVPPSHQCIQTKTLKL